MMTIDIMNDEDKGEIIEFEHRGKHFLICKEGQYQYWVVRHPYNKVKVAAIDGAFTTLAQAQRAIMNLSEGHFEVKPRKETLVPKGPRLNKDNTEE